MSSVFLAHSSDAKDFTRELNNRLDAAGYSTFFDEANLRFAGGYDVPIADAAKGCRMFFFVISKGSVADDAYALTELGWALETKRKIAGIFAPGHESVTPPAEVSARLYVPSEGDRVANAIGFVAHRRRMTALTIAVIVLVMAALFGLGGISYARYQAEMLTAEAIEAKAGGRAEDAATLFERTIQFRLYGLLPCSVELYVQLGLVQEEISYDSAKAAYENAIACLSVTNSDYDRITALNNLGWIHLHHDGRPDYAEAKFQKAFELVGRGALEQAGESPAPEQGMSNRERQAIVRKNLAIAQLRRTPQQLDRVCHNVESATQLFREEGTLLDQRIMFCLRASVLMAQSRVTPSEPCSSSAEFCSACRPLRKTIDRHMRLCRAQSTSMHHLGEEEVRNQIIKDYEEFKKLPH